MKKILTTYSSYHAELGSLEIQENESYEGYKNLSLKFDEMWRSKEDTIKYLQLCIKHVKGLQDD